jgi:hypothetical protein
VKSETSARAVSKRTVRGEEKRNESGSEKK